MITKPPILVSCSLASALGSARRETAKEAPSPMCVELSTAWGPRNKGGIAVEIVRLARSARVTKSNTFGTKGASSTEALVAEVSGEAVGVSSDEAGTEVKGLPDSWNAIRGKPRSSRGQEQGLGDR